MVYKELPLEVTMRIYKDYLFPEFIEATRDLFKVKNDRIGR